MSGRGTHRLYGLSGTAGIRGETAVPRRYGRRRGRPPKVVAAEPLPPAPLPAPAVPARLDRLEIDTAAPDALLADTERVQAALRGRGGT